MSTTNKQTKASAAAVKTAYFNRFEIELPIEAVRDCSAAGSVDDSVAYWAPKIPRSGEITADMLRDELKECGAWDTVELLDSEANWRRIVWLAACNIKEEMAAEQGHRASCVSGNQGPEWSGSPNPADPDNSWIRARVKLASLILAAAGLVGCETGGSYQSSSPAVYSSNLAPADAAGIAAGFNAVRAIQASEAAAVQQAEQTQAIQSIANAINYRY